MTGHEIPVGGNSQIYSCMVWTEGAAKDDNVLAVSIGVKRISSGDSATCKGNLRVIVTKKNGDTVQKDSGEQTKDIFSSGLQPSQDNMTNPFVVLFETSYIQFESDIDTIFPIFEYY